MGNKFNTINPQVCFNLHTLTLLVISKLQTVPPQEEIYKLLNHIAKSNGLNWTSDFTQPPQELGTQDGEDLENTAYEDEDEDDLLKELEQFQIPTGNIS